jgi:myosin heavy subunit
MQGIDQSGDQPTQSKLLLSKYDTSNWQLGHTKVFMREALENTLEKDRHQRLKKTVQKIQAFILGHIQRKRFLAKRQACIRMQAVIRMYLIRSEYLRRVR